MIKVQGRDLQNNERVDFYDYLRAIAILLVVVTHYKNSLLPGGSVGVSIFFCLSGFLIAKVLLRESKLDIPVVKGFLIRRFLRVYPAYIVSLLLIWLLLALTKSEYLNYFTTSLPGLLLFVQRPTEWIGMTVGVLWTLQIEFWFYLLLPVVMLLVGRGRLLSVIIFAVAICLYSKWLLLTSEHLKPLLYTPLSVFVWGDNLLFGVVVSIISKDTKIKSTRWLWALAAVALLSILGLAKYVSASEYGVWVIMSSIASFLTGIIIFCYEKQPFDLKLVWLAWIGEISYSIYLLHGFMLDFNVAGMSFLITLLLAFMSAIVAPAILNRFIERPGIRIGKSLALSIKNYS